jgi:hypothetical protein
MGRGSYDIFAHQKLFIAYLNCRLTRYTIGMTMLIDITSCVYCGQTANTVDHFIPISKETKHQQGQFEVPCCSECNSSSRDRLFETFHEKLSWLLARALLKGRARLETLSLTLPLVDDALKHQRPSKGCVVCRKPFSRNKHGNRRLYCGPICATRAGRHSGRRAAMQK